MCAVTNYNYGSFVLAQQNWLPGYLFRLTGHEPEDFNDKLPLWLLLVSYSRSCTNRWLSIRGSWVRGSLDTSPEYQARYVRVVSDGYWTG